MSIARSCLLGSADGCGAWFWSPGIAVRRSFRSRNIFTTLWCWFGTSQGGKASGHRWVLQLRVDCSFVPKGSLLPPCVPTSNESGVRPLIVIDSIIDCSISLDHRGPSIRSWSSRKSMIRSICSMMNTARSCSTIIWYTRASWIMTDHSTHLSDCVL